MQVFYITDMLDKKWLVILPGKRYTVGDDDVVDENDYDHFDKIPPFSTGVEPVQVDDNEEKNYMRSDHV
jgi:hypothetical protein